MTTQNPRTYVSPRETNPFALFQIRRSHLKTRIPGTDTNPGHYVSTTPALTDEARHRVALVVAGHARDATDARDLLETLGIIARPKEAA